MLCPVHCECPDMNPPYIPYDEGDGPSHAEVIHEPPPPPVGYTYDPGPLRKPSDTDTDDDILIVVPAPE